MKIFFTLVLVVILLPLMAQDTQKEQFPEQEFEQIVQEFFELSDQMMRQMSDTSMMKMSPQGLLKLYGFSEKDGSIQQLLPNEFQELFDNGFGKMDTIGGVNPFELLDMDSFLRSIPDSLRSDMNPFELFLGEEFNFPEGIENSKKKKKRKVYSL